MKVSLVANLFGSFLVLAASRFKRAAYDLPDGAELLLGDAKATFACINDSLYYADQDNFCNTFQFCHTAVNLDGTSEMIQWYFLCGNKVIVNQFSLTCPYPAVSVPCKRARDFWYLKVYPGTVPNDPFHIEHDISTADTVIQESAAHPLKPQNFQAGERLLGRPASIIFETLRREAPSRPRPPTRYHKG